MDADPIRQAADDDIFEFAAVLMQNKTIGDCHDVLERITNESVNARDYQGYTRLEWASAFSRHDFRNYLMKKGATLPDNQFHRNVLFIRLQYVDENLNETPDTLSPETIDFRGTNAMNDTALHLALYGSKWDMVKMILEHNTNEDLNTVNSSDEMPLHLAAKSKCGIRIFEQIVRRTTRANIGAFDAYGYTALHWAANEGSAKKIKLLLDKEADVNARDKGNGNTALHLALMKKSKTAAEELLECCKVDVNLKEQRSWTALHQAAAWSNVPADLLQKIFQKSSDVNAKTILGRTALHLAVRKRSLTATRELLSCGNGQNGQLVDVNVGDGHGKTALHYATEWQDIPVDLFRNILRKSANVNVVEKVEEATALHFALEKQSIIATTCLLEHADVSLDIKNKKHFVPLHYAAQWRDIPQPVFNAILERTIDLNSKEKTGGFTALHLAIDAKSETAIIQLLKHENVDVNIEDSHKRTATHLMDSWPDVPPDLRLLLDIRLQRLNATLDPEQPIGHDLSVETNGKLRNDDANNEGEVNYIARHAPYERKILAEFINQTEPPIKTIIAVKENELRQRRAHYQLNEQRFEIPPDREYSFDQYLSFSRLSLILLFLRKIRYQVLSCRQTQPSNFPGNMIVQHPISMSDDSPVVVTANDAHWIIIITLNYVIDESPTVEKRVEVTLSRLEETNTARQFDKATILAKELAAMKRAPTFQSLSKQVRTTEYDVTLPIPPPVINKPMAAPRSVLPVFAAVVIVQKQSDPIVSAPSTVNEATAAPLPAKRLSDLSSLLPLPRKTIKEKTQNNQEETVTKEQVTVDVNQKTETEMTTLVFQKKPFIGVMEKNAKRTQSCIVDETSKCDNL
ncbi:uncharacterized protein LOC132088406 [Daphnia carinata]|uniref:uncharacterized protein LOC132088406 n=1 Tax=Daphnia carinata TaxID=120202 RepID=UPI0028684541|nr:uncharacterized protein LOC132088406 [Daphnia carinata]